MPQTLPRLTFLLATTLSALTLPSHAADSNLRIHAPYVRLAPPGAAATGAFMRIENAGATDRQLIKAESPAAKTVELHTHLNEGGMMKMRAPLSDLRTLTATQQLVKKEQKKLERKKSMREARVDITTRAVRQELDVRGMALDEAIPEVEKFIDDAMLSSLGEVSIIHGNGTGVLRAGIQDCLRRHPCVSSFRLGRYGEGETGVTIVSLK